jgi:hypothetical protein
MRGLGTFPKIEKSSVCAQKQKEEAKIAAIRKSPPGFFPSIGFSTPGVKPSRTQSSRYFAPGELAAP